MSRNPEYCDLQEELYLLKKLTLEALTWLKLIHVDEKCACNLGNLIVRMEEVEK